MVFRISGLLVLLGLRVYGFIAPEPPKHVDVAAS